MQTCWPVYINDLESVGLYHNDVMAIMRLASVSKSEPIR